MITRESVAGLVGRRVEVVWGGDAYREFLQYRGMTPDGLSVYLADGNTGRESKHAISNGPMTAIIDAPLTCAQCGCETQRLFGPDTNFCADCEREWAARHASKPYMECEKDGCQNDNAFYSPKARRFLCPSCHANGRTLSGMGPEARVLEDVAHSRRKAAACRSDDIESYAHDWVQVKSKRVCRLCGQNVFVGEFRRDPCRD